QNCLGAIDGTLINVRTTTESRPRFRTRKGTTAINVLAVWNQNLQFTYCLAGWEGSAHDSRVLRDALSRAGGFRVPEGKTFEFQFRLHAKFHATGFCWHLIHVYSFHHPDSVHIVIAIGSIFHCTGKFYLCDAGYTNAKGFLPPYRGQRYHLQEWGRNRPRTPEEYFNMKHVSARNVIEKAFGILKMRWAFLRDTSWYSPRMVGIFFNACMLLHNFIRKEGGVDVFEMAYVPPAEEEETFVESIDEPAAYVEPTEEWTQFRHHLAEYMWANRGR
ncbi:hypothetical protein LINPERHAP1_LOCUS20278, partial [Linum perenne]